MKTIAPESIKPGDCVMVTATTGVFRGFVGKMAEIKAVDWPFAVIMVDFKSLIANSRDLVDLREYEFALPSAALLEALNAEAEWPQALESSP